MVSSEKNLKDKVVVATAERAWVESLAMRLYAAPLMLELFRKMKNRLRLVCHFLILPIPTCIIPSFLIKVSGRNSSGAVIFSESGYYD